MAIYDSSTLGTPENYITFNDDTSTTYYRMKTRTPNRREISEFDLKLPEGTGDSDFESFIGKTYMIIEGIMYPDDEADFHNARENLRKLASLEVQQNDSQSDGGYVLHKWSENVGKQIALKVMYVDMAESTRQGLKQPFRLVCKVKYPHITSQESKTVQLGVATVNQLGGATIPATIAMSIPSTESGGSSVFSLTLPTVFGGTRSSGSTVAVNDGDVDTFPTIQIYGPCSRPKVVNRRTGEYIELDINLPTSSDAAIISYDQDSLSVTAMNQNAYGKLTSGSTLFKIKPGENPMTFTGASVGAGAYCNVAFFDAYPLS